MKTLTWEEAVKEGVFKALNDLDKELLKLVTPDGRFKGKPEWINIVRSVSEQIKHNYK